MLLTNGKDRDKAYGTVGNGMSREVSIEVDGRRVKAPEGIMVQRALEASGYRISRYQEGGSLFVVGDMHCSVMG